jgi:hypothetical protein
MGLLQSLGNVADLPGSMVRDALALRNPLDQLLSPLSQDGRTSGQELIGMYGGGDHPLLGTALEMALDPASYFGIGVASRGAKALGLADKARKALSSGKRGASAVKSALQSRQSAMNALEEARSGLGQMAGRATDAAKDFFSSPASAINALGTPGGAFKAGSIGMNPGTPWSLGAARELATRAASNVGGAAMDVAYGTIPGARDLAMAGLMATSPLARLGGVDEGYSEMPPEQAYTNGPMIPPGARFNFSGVHSGPDPMLPPPWAQRYRYSVGGPLGG